MKKNVLIGSLILVSLVSMSYGIYQKLRADKLEVQLSKELLLKAEREKNLKEALNYANRRVEEIKALEQKKLQRSN